MMRLLGSLLRDARGVMAIETAIVAPVLALMALGTFEVGSMVSRQQELQSAASEAEGIILATAAGEATDSATVKAIIQNSLGLNADQVSLEQRFRCNTATALVTDQSTCPADGTPVYRFVQLQVTDSYTPVWASFGIGSRIDYNIVRTVQVN